MIAWLRRFWWDIRWMPCYRCGARFKSSVDLAVHLHEHTANAEKL